MHPLHGGYGGKPGCFGSQDPRAQAQALETRLPKLAHVLIGQPAFRADNQNGGRQVGQFPRREPAVRIQGQAQSG